MIRVALALSALALAALSGGCSDYKQETRTTARNESVTSRSPGAVAMFRQGDPTISKFFDGAFGYAVFPEIAKGAAGIGAANGSGTVYRAGQVVGFTEMTQVTVGAQIGGQSYRMIIFFQDAAAFSRFTSGNLEFSANASAVIVKSGAAAANDYRDGLAVFVQPIAGAMAEASIGGQRFTYRPLSASGAARPASSTPLTKIAHTGMSTGSTSVSTGTGTTAPTMPVGSTRVSTAKPVAASPAR
jgi:lipid-binding SYLF domain-containing protein